MRQDDSSCSLTLLRKEMPLEILTDPQVGTPNADVFIPTKEFTINRCKVILNLAPDSNGKAIETAKSILLSACYQNIPHIPAENQANG